MKKPSSVPRPRPRQRRGNWIQYTLIFITGAYLGSFSNLIVQTIEESTKKCQDDTTRRGPDPAVSSNDDKLANTDKDHQKQQQPLFHIQNPICQELASLHTSSTTASIIPDALSIWMNALPQIHAASELTPNENNKYYFHDYFAQLLAIVTPRLPHSIQSLPAGVHHDDTARILQRILLQVHQRWQEQQQSTVTTDTTTKPIKVVILGGSVLVGRNCRKLVKDLNIQAIRMPQRHCNYAHRLETFLDNLFPNMVKVTNVAVGGTNSAVGAQIFQYDLLPPEAKQPDIVINAYSTNDMHVLTMLEAEASNTTLHQRVFDITQDFVRAVLTNSCTTKKPLLIHLDDYLGNEQREILATTELSQGVQVLAHYYGFASISYANVVRPWVYGDTKEYWFSPEGWWEGGKKEMAREIHPGMGMHMITCWIIAFAFLQMTTTFCSSEAATMTSFNLDYQSSFLAAHIPLRGKYSDIPGKPMDPPHGIPPRLTKELNLETVSQDWRQVRETEITCEGERCPFSWLGGISNQQNNKTWVVEHFKKHEEISEFELTDDGGKLGWVPRKADASMILNIKASSPISAVTIFFLKSYGDKWQDSQVQIDVHSDSVSKTLLGSCKLQGFHGKETSEMYTETLTLLDTTKSTGIRFKMQLIGGSTFKMMGLAICK